MYCSFKSTTPKTYFPSMQYHNWPTDAFISPQITNCPYSVCLAAFHLVFFNRWIMYFSIFKSFEKLSSVLKSVYSHTIPTWSRLEVSLLKLFCRVWDVTHDQTVLSPWEAILGQVKEFKVCHSVLPNFRVSIPAITNLLFLYTSNLLEHCERKVA